MNEEKKCPKCGADQMKGEPHPHFLCGSYAQTWYAEGKDWAFKTSRSCVERQLSQLTKERDAWKAATGRGSMTAEEAGDQIDAQNKELADARAKAEHYLRRYEEMVKAFPLPLHEARSGITSGYPMGAEIQEVKLDLEPVRVRVGFSLFKTDPRKYERELLRLTLATWHKLIKEQLAKAILPLSLIPEPLLLHKKTTKTGEVGIDDLKIENKRLRKAAVWLLMDRPCVTWGWSHSRQVHGYFLRGDYVGATMEDVLAAEAGKEK